jgi:hypothetical protein
MILTAAAVLAIANQCLPPTLAPIAASIAMHENPKLDTQAVNVNRNGSVDYGLGQINSSNFAWLSTSLNTPVNAQTIRDNACLNLQAAIRILFVRYNGHPPDAVAARYASAAMASIAQVDPAPTGPNVTTSDLAHHGTSVWLSRHRCRTFHN